MVVKSATKQQLMGLGLQEPIAHALSGDTQINQVLAYTYPEFMEQLWWGNNGYANEWQRAVTKILSQNRWMDITDPLMLSGNKMRFIRDTKGIDNIGKDLIWEPLIKNGQTWEDMIKKKLYVLGDLFEQDWDNWAITGSVSSIKGEDAFNNKELQRIFLSLNPARRERGYPEQKIKPNYFGPAVFFMNWDSNPL